MKFKSQHMKDQLEASPAMLQDIAGYADAYMLQHFGKEFFVTRCWDRVAQESGVHPEKRAVDGRVEYATDGGTAHYITEDQAKELCTELNRKYPRIDGKLVAIAHRVPGSTLHIHIQIPASWVTRRREEVNYGY